MPPPCPASAPLARDDSRRLIESLESPDCGCPFRPITFATEDGDDGKLSDTRVRDPEIPEYRFLAVVFGTDACRHTMDTDHGLSLKEWAELLVALDPNSYTDPPPPPEAPAVCGTEAVVTVYRQRASGRRKFHLYRADDFWRNQGLDDRIKVGPLALHAANGYTVESGEVAVAGRIGPQEVPEKSLVDELLDEMGDFQRSLFERGTALRLAREAEASAPATLPLKAPARRRAA